MKNDKMNNFDLPVIAGIVIVVFAIGATFFLSGRAGKTDYGPEESGYVLEESQKDGNLSGNEESVSSSSFKIEVTKEGAGKEAKIGEKIKVNYDGFLEDGAKFDSSYDRGAPFEFVLGAGQVIKGWDKGVLGMKVGEKRRITVPPELGYDETGVPGAIPPNATLIFEVERL